MDVTPKTLREVVFREKKVGGYHHDDVDEFLEQVAVALEGLQDRLRQAVERAQRAESAAAAATAAAPPPAEAASSGVAASNTDEALRTLVLAQRTADMAVQESREQAARLLANAEQQAQSLISDTEDRSRRLHDDALAATKAELAVLESTRSQAQQEVEALNRWIEEHKAHLSSTLRDALAVVDRSGTLSPPPKSRAIDLGQGDSSRSSSGGASVDAGRQDSADRPASARSGVPPSSPPPPPSGEGSAGSEGPPIRSGAAAPDEFTTGEHEVATGPGRATAKADTADPYAAGGGAEGEEQALDDFFDEPELSDDRRFGGRLRRRR